MPSFPIEQPQRIISVDMEPAIKSADKSTKDIFVGEASMDILNMKNRVAIGIPHYENLSSRFREKGEKFSYSIEHMLKDYDFHLVSLSCTFSPDINSRFDWVRFGVQLLTEPKEDAKVKPIVHHLFPSEIVQPLKCKRLINVDSELTLRPDISEKQTIEEMTEYIVYQPMITSFGLGSSTVAWDFNKVDDKGLYGDRVLLLIIRVQKNAKVKGRFLLGAEVSSSLSKKWIRIPFRRRTDALIDQTYDLSK
jgi:hypothetical protein